MWRLRFLHTDLKVLEIRLASGCACTGAHAISGRLIKIQRGDDERRWFVFELFVGREVEAGFFEALEC